MALACLLFSVGGMTMSYDCFEQDWNGIPASEVERNNPSGNLFRGNRNQIPPPPAPKEESPSISNQYRQRPASEKKPTFIQSPCCEWKAQAAKLTKSAILAGDVIWHKAGLEKDKFVKEGRPESKPLKLNAHLRKRLNVSPSQMSRGIKALEEAGLLQRLEMTPGKLQVVVLINVWQKRQQDECANDTTHDCSQRHTERLPSEGIRVLDASSFYVNQMNNAGDKQ